MRKPRKRPAEKYCIIIALKGAGFVPEWRSPTHCILEVFGCRWDIWPTTDKWMRRIKGAKATVRKGTLPLLCDIETERIKL